ncbi:hypothetical protein HCH52_10790 [Oscillospiraceae bacterium HV4-5-C5C]|nr:hypothetical protein [Oscillospiraceae bacterium HV4-5-C5C]
MALQEIWGRNTAILDPELLRREQANYQYMMKLSTANLLLNYQLEAGRTSFMDYPEDLHGGWESVGCQLRGHFLGHWLSAAAMHYYETGDQEMKGKADTIIDELYLCQQDNGHGWVGPIPEKYLDWIAVGKPVWAPQYTLHKILMGLVDMYLYAANTKALTIAEGLADWFYAYSGRYTKAEFAKILDVETGGMLEIWARLYQITHKDKYHILMDRYYRSSLFDALLAGKDPLTNMHANTTIPEVLGCAAAFEATGDPKWQEIVTAYWTCAVDDRGCFVTGGQTSGEIWTPKQKLSQRLGDKNQEHCTVYNMLRLANYLFRQTKNPLYLDYYEKNLYNGIMAQAYWKSSVVNGSEQGPSTGLLTYFLPLGPGSRKGWASETHDFFCCHGTLVQANAAFNRGLYYIENTDVYVAQYLDSETSFEIAGQPVRLLQKEDRQTGSFHLSSTSAGRQTITELTSQVASHPENRIIHLAVLPEKPVFMTLHLRVPDWVQGDSLIEVNGEALGDPVRPGSWVSIYRLWSVNDHIYLRFKQRIMLHPLPDLPSLAAFSYGPLALVGLTNTEETISVDPKHPEAILMHHNEREWGNWKNSFKTVGQDHAILFKPISEVGYETYTVYFRIKARI